MMSLDRKTLAHKPLRQTLIHFFTLGLTFGTLVFPTLSTAAVDTDQDGLSDDDEINLYHTNPNKADSDNDGLTDKQEVLFKRISGTHLNFTNLYGGKSSSMGKALSNAGDVDNDGYPDLIVGGHGKGTVKVISSRTNQVLYTFQDTVTSYSGYGRSVLGLGDVNQDNHSDFAIGDLKDKTHGSLTGAIEVRSGKNGGILYKITGKKQYSYMGNRIASAGDVNNDGITDIISGSAYRAVDKYNFAEVYSGADGSLLYTFKGTPTYDRFGISVAGVGDLNKDGHDDVIVGAYRDDTFGPDAGSATVFSGIDGSVIYKLNGKNSKDDNFGATVSAAGDINDDGYPDLMIGNIVLGESFYPSKQKYVQINSGKDGSVLKTIESDSTTGDLGGVISAAGDFDCDGSADIALASPETAIIGDTPADKKVYYKSRAGKVSIYSYKKDAFIAQFDILDKGYEGTRSKFGSALAIADFDADGCDDLIIGAPRTRYFRGNAYRTSISLLTLNPNKADSDNNGVIDGDQYPELKKDTENGNNTGNNGTDTDGDGLTDQEEITRYNTDPFNADSDGDGLTDGLEINLYSTNPNSIDSDNDGLTDGQEINQFSLNPLKADSNGNGVNDYFEVPEAHLNLNVRIEYLYENQKLKFALREKSETEYYVAEYTIDYLGNTVLINTSVKLKTDPSLILIQ